MIHIYHLCVIFFPAHKEVAPPMWDESLPGGRSDGDYTHTHHATKRIKQFQTLDVSGNQKLIFRSNILKLKESRSAIQNACLLNVFGDCPSMVLHRVMYDTNKEEVKRTIWKHRIYSRYHRAHIFPWTKRKKLLSDLSLPPWRSLIYPTCPQ